MQCLTYQIIFTPYTHTNNNTDSIKTGATKVTNIFFYFAPYYILCFAAFIKIVVTPAMTGIQWIVNYHCLVTKISSDHSQKSFQIPELFERQLYRCGGRRRKLFSNALYSILGKKLYWQSASCTVQTSYGL